MSEEIKTLEERYNLCIQKNKELAEENRIALEENQALIEQILRYIEEEERG